MMPAKVSPQYILSDHLSTLNGSKVFRGDYFLFHGVPTIVAFVVCGAYIAGWSYPGGVLNSLRATLSVFTPLLFNVLVLALNMASQPERHDFPKLQQETLVQVYANTSYSILVALITLALLLVDGIFDWMPWNTFIASVVTGLSVNFGLTMFMVLRRMHTLMKRHS